MRFLLDSHLPAVLAARLEAGEMDAESLAGWQGGAYVDASDEELLSAAAVDGRVLVTHDCHTIPLLLKEWAEMGRAQGGVVLVDERTLRPSDVGGLLAALMELARRLGDADWRDRAVYLRRQGGG